MSKVKTGTLAMQRADRITLAFTGTSNVGTLAWIRSYELIGQIISYGERRLRREQDPPAPLLGKFDRELLFRAYCDAGWIPVQFWGGDARGVIMDIQFFTNRQSTAKEMAWFRICIRPWGHIDSVTRKT